MRVKICGVTRAQDAQLACSLGAWAVGLIFVPTSPRAIDVEAARRLRSAIAQGTLAIGVFADADPAIVADAVRRCKLDAVQLHGSEDPETCKRVSAPAYKAMPMTEAQDVERLEPYSGRVAGFLAETVRRLPSGRERVDAQERRRRWRLVSESARFGPVILAGELAPDNVAEAIRLAHPAGVDVCGGVEAEPGVKDPAKLEAFFKAVRAAELS